MSFLISAYGRSGTMFLSTVMNMSKTFTVKHEPRGIKDMLPNNFSYVDIFRGNYGEVNSMMRMHIENIINIQKGIILRNPLDILLSGINRKCEDKHNFICEDIIKMFYKFDDYITNKNMIFINFHLMTSDICYLQNILETFNIVDVKVNKQIINKKINEKKKNKYQIIPKPLIEKISKLDFMIEKYDLHKR